MLQISFVLEEMATSEKKKSRLEALERRLSAAPSTPQARSQGILRKISVPTGSPSSFGPPQVARTPAEIAERERTYAQLCPSVVNGPLYSLLKLSRGQDDNGVVNDVLKDLLERNSRLQGDVDNILDTRLQENQVLLLDNPTAVQQTAAEKARERAYKSRGTRSREHLSLRQHRKCGSYDLPQEFQEYKLYQPLQEMWANYVKDLLSECSDTMVQSRLLTADLHGAVLSVVESKNSSHVGARGVMVRETENTFGLVTPNNKFRVIPKVGSIFRVEIENVRVTLFGNNLRLRSSATNTKRGRQKRLTTTIEL